MRRITKARPSPALVVAFIALFVALSGGALALKKNSVKTKNIKNSAVTNPKLADGAVNGAKVAGNSLTGGNIDESTLTGVTPAGAAGGGLTGSYPNPNIASGAVGTSETGTMPAARATKTSGSPQSIPNSSATTISLNSEAAADGGFDNANMHDDAVNNSRLTAPVGGVYLVTAEVGGTPTQPGCASS